MIDLESYKSNQFYKHEGTVKHLKAIKPKLANKVMRIMAELERDGWQPIIAEGVRTKAQQAVKVRQGNSKTMKSKHLTGDAVDIVDKRYGWNGVAANLGYQFWRKYGELCTNDSELRWGGDWGRGYERYIAYINHEVVYFVDVAHVELRPD